MTRIGFWTCALTVVLARVPAAAQSPVDPVVTVPAVSVMLPNYNTVPIGEVASLEAGAFVAQEKLHAAHGHARRPERCGDLDGVLVELQHAGERAFEVGRAGAEEQFLAHGHGVRSDPAEIGEPIGACGAGVRRSSAGR